MLDQSPVLPLQYYLFVALQKSTGSLIVFESDRQVDLFSDGPKDLNNADLNYVGDA